MKNKNIYCFIFFSIIFVLFLSFFPASKAGAQSFYLEAIPSCFNSKTQVSLSWEEAGTNPIYYIERKLSGGVYSTIANTTSLSYVDSNNILSDRSYYYRIRAVGGGTFYSQEQLVPAQYCAPYIYSINSSCLADGPRIAFSWHAVSGNFLRYEIFRKKEGEPQFSYLTQTSLTSFTDGPNIEGAKSYSYAVKAIWQNNASSTGISPWQVANICPVDLSLSASCLSSSPGGPENFLSWNSLAGVEKYEIWRKPVNGSGFIKTIELSDNSYFDKLAETLPDNYYLPGANYYYVKAVWPGGYNSQSVTRQQNSLDCPPFLTIQDNCDEKSMRLFWTRVLGATSTITYRILRNGVYLNQSDAGKNNFVDSVLPQPGCGDPPSCNITYIIQALESGTDSGNILTSINCVSPPVPSPAPVLQNPTTECRGSPLKSVVKNEWSPSQYVYYYKLFRNGELVSPGPGFETFYDDFGVEGGQNYAYYVNAFNNTGEVSSNQVNIQSASCYLPSPNPQLGLDSSCSEGGRPEINLSWTASAHTVNYTIYRGPTEFDLTELETVELNILNYKDVNVATSTKYHYKIRANGFEGVGFSDSLTLEITSSHCLPTVPSLWLTNGCNGLQSIINVNWSTDELNTVRYEIFRNNVLVKEINSPLIKTWQDNTVISKTSYQYRVEAIGILGQRSKSSNVNIVSWFCWPPDNFNLNNAVVSCNNSYPWSSLSWDNSPNAVRYDLNRYLYSGNTVIATNTLKVGATTSFIDRGSGYALKFDGGTGLVEIGSSDDFDNLAKFSLEFWIKPETKGFLGVLNTCNSYSCDGGGYNFYLRNQANQDFQFTLTNSLWRSYNYETDKWYHVVSTYDDRYMRLYVNNQYIGQYSKASTTFTYPIKISASKLTIGGGIPSVGNFRGLIDEVRIYANVIPQTLVQEHYYGNYSGDYNGCGNSGGQNCDIRGLWRFDEGSGIVVTDSSNRNNNGTIKGSPLPEWVLNGPQIETKYSWQAIAYSNGPDPTFSNITPSVITPSCPPAQPGILLTPTCSPNSGIRIDWSYSINANEYQIWRSIENNPAVKIKEFIPPPPSDSLQWQDSGLTTGTNYTYFVRAVGNGGFTDSASSSLAAPFCNLPGSVENVNAVSGCSGSFPRITLTWDSSANADWYEVFRNGDSYKSTPDTHIFDDYPNLKTGRKYSYLIVPHNTAGAGASSSEASTTAAYCPVSKSSLSVSAYCSSTNPAVEMNFTDSTFFDSKEYIIWRSGNGSPVSTIVATDTSALKFTTNPITDYIRCGNDPSLNITEKLTIELWVKLGSITQSQNFISKGRVLADGTNYQLGTGSGGSRLRFRWGVGDNRIDSNYHNFSTNAWNHIAVTVDTVNDILVFYKNGALLSSHAFTGSLLAVGDPLMIGYGSDAVFKGSIDELRIYNRILSPAEIMEHYNKNYGNHDISIRGLWRFNEGNGRIARDSSGYANDCNMFPEYQYGVYWENLSESDPTYYLTDIRFSNEYRSLNDSQNLQSNTNYSYWVETIGHAGPATSSDSKSITTPNCNVIPNPPVNLNLNSGCVAYRDPFNYLSWNPSSNAFSYNIYRSTTSGPVSTFYNYGSPFFDRRSFVLDFDGSATTNIRIKDPIYGSRVLDGLAAVSVEFWIYFDPGGSRDRNILKDDGMVFHGFPNSAFHLSGPGGGSGYLGYNRSLSLGAWHHFVGTWDRSQEGNNMKLYLNGELQSEQRFDKANYLYYGSSNLLINDGWQGGYGSIDGKIDELRVYSRALRAEEVAEHFNGIYKDESGLKGLWHFDEGGSFPTPDESGYGNHGTVNGSVPVNGRIGNAFRFNTSTDYINCGNPDVLNSTSAITLQAWVYPTSWQSYPRIVSKETGNSAYPYALEYMSNSIRLYIRRQGDTGEILAAQSSGAPPLNQWTHVAATWDGISGNGRIYFNGVQSGSTVNRPGTMVSNLNNFLIGNSPTGERPWKGYLDEVRIYNRALGGSEISTCFSDPDNCSEVDLIGFWPLDEGLSSTLIDSSGNNNHGYIVKSGADWLWATSGNAFYNSKIHRSTIEEVKSYDYLVTACGMGTESNFSELKNITSSLCQPYIENFSVIPGCYNGPSGQQEPVMHLAWDSNAESFTVMRKREGTTEFQTIVSITDEAFDDISIENTPGFEYQYYIIAHDSLYGENVYSEVKSATVSQCIAVILKPVITEILPYCPGSGPGAWPRIKVSWGPPSNPLAVGYEIWRRAEICDEGPSWASTGEAYGTMSFIDSDSSIENNKYYCYKVRAFDLNNNFTDFSDSSGTMTGDCVNSPPTPFPDIFLENLSYPWRAGNLWINIRWEDVEAEKGYNVFRKPCSEGWGDRTDPGNNPWLIAQLPFHENTGELELIFYTDYYPGFLDDACYHYSIVAWNDVAHILSNDLEEYFDIALPGIFTIAGNDLGSNIIINLTSEPATTAAAGRAYYTFYRGGDLAYQEALSTGIISTEPGKWATFTNECIATTSLSCVDQAPDRNKRYYVVTARATNANQSPDYTPSNLLDLFIFAPKWKEIPIY